MSFAQELTCRWPTSTWTPTRLLPARSFAQKLLHRSCHTGVQLTSRWSNCIWTPAKSGFSSSSISLWRQGQPGVAYETLPSAACRTPKLVCPWATLCGDRACRMGKHVLWWNAKLLCPQQPSAEIVRFERPMWWNVNFFWARATLEICRDRAGRTSKHVALNANLVRPGAAPSQEMRVNRQKLV